MIFTPDCLLSKKAFVMRSGLGWRRCNVGAVLNVASDHLGLGGIHSVDELAEEDEEVRDYVRALEETRDTADLPEATGEAIAREFERYLKRRETDDG